MSMAQKDSPLMNEIDKSSDSLLDHDELLIENKFDDDDPLVIQLPPMLKQFVRRPSDHLDHVSYVTRDNSYAMLHKSIAVICCCWSACRQVLVEQGQIGLTQNADRPELLGPGRHVLLSPFNEFIGVRNVTDPMIRHGPLHIIRVEMGQLGYGVNMRTGRPVILTRGKHIINSNDFVWKKFITLQDRITQLDQLNVIRIETGNVGYCYRKGNLVIIEPGLHVIEPPDRFGDILSTQMQIIELPYSVFETADYVELAIKSALFFRIDKPERALRRISNITSLITDTAVATIAGIIRSSSLSDIASRNVPKQFYDKKQSEDINSNLPDDVPSAPPFFEHVHDEFLTQLHDHVLNEWGIDIQNIRIESLKINDPTLQKNISNQAIDVSKQHNKYLMLQKKSEIEMVQANAQSNKNKIDTDAKARAIRANAQAEADAIVIRGKARKKALILKGAAEAEYARLLQSTKLGREMSVMQIQCEALKNKKAVAYVNHLPGILGAQDGLFSYLNSTNEKK